MARLWGVDHPGFHRFRLSYAMEAVESISGDLLCSALLPGGGQRVLLGDLAGHGAAAATCAPLLIHVFYQAAAAGEAAAAALGLLGAALHRHARADVFMAFVLAEWSEDRSGLWLWNGGLPGCFRVGAGGMVEHFPSRCQPLGVAGEGRAAAECQAVATAAGDQVFLFTDGFSEAADSAGDPLGVAGAEALLLARATSVGLGDVIAGLSAYRGGRPSADDVTVVGLRP